MSEISIAAVLPTAPAAQAARRHGGVGGAEGANPSVIKSGRGSPADHPPPDPPRVNHSATSTARGATTTCATPPRVGPGASAAGTAGSVQGFMSD